ncbi:MAG TPA: bifunctional diguanylate cyclase/phosphodiesterase [Afifellaceae bacterium]|nr:bifunctional diguanylate cyclase/phosphodiesterase [Afifellaceae bacterium]
MPLKLNREFGKDYRRLLPLFAAAVFAIACVFVVTTSRNLGHSTLHSDALATAEEAARELAAGRGPASEYRLSRIAAYALYDGSGQVQASDRLVETEELIRYSTPKTAAGAPVSLSGASQETISTILETVPAGLIGSAPAKYEVWVPANRFNAAEGAAWVLVDQTGSAAATVGALEKAAGLILLILLPLFIILTWLAARKPKEERASARPRLPQGGRRDALTGLPDRIQFQDQLEQAIKEATQTDTSLAVIAIDLDRFKSVNDLWGHAVGDELILEAVERLKPLAGVNGTLARINGDEFAILYRDDANPRTLKYLGQRVVDDLSEPYQVDDDPISLTASVGIAAFPINAENADALFRAADLALFKAKSEGKQMARFFDTEMDKQLRRRSKLERDLRHALQHDEFVVFYQPQMNLKTGELCGYEALIRWERPGEGIVSPMDFIPVAEETGLIKPLGEWVLRKACQDAAEWIEFGTVAVNFSASQFSYAGVDEMIARVVKETGIEPQRLEIEITESLFLNHSPDVMATLKRIKDLGVRIAMDDFGTGYSSLNYLTQFPFDKIKIDRSFVSQLSNDPQIAAIISSIVGLGRSLSVDITAEGVETDEQVTLLQAAGCSIVQGFLFGAPTRAGHTSPDQRASA